MSPALSLRLADAVVLLHAGFVLLGGLLVLRWPRLAWVHVPAAGWGAWVEFANLVCPLTPLENWLRSRGGGPVHTGSFVDQYVLPLLYPAALSREVPWALGTTVIIVNLMVYTALVRRRRRRRPSPPGVA